MILTEYIKNNKIFLPLKLDVTTVSQFDGFTFIIFIFIFILNYIVQTKPQVPTKDT